MKIWKEFNSSHSSNISIVGTFRNAEEANQVFAMIEDFTLASWEERYPSIEEFKQHWAANSQPDIPYWGLHQSDYETGIDNQPRIGLDGSTISISRFRSSNIGGIVKLLLYTGANNIQIGS